MNIKVRIRNNSPIGRTFSWIGVMGTWIDKDNSIETAGDPWSLASETERLNMDADVRAGNVELKYIIDLPEIKKDADVEEAVRIEKTKAEARLTMPVIVESKETERVAKNFGFEVGAMEDNLPRPEMMEKPAMQTVLPAPTRLEDMLEGTTVQEQQPAPAETRDRKMD